MYHLHIYLGHLQWRLGIIKATESRGWLAWKLFFLWVAASEAFWQELVYIINMSMSVPAITEGKNYPFLGWQPVKLFDENCFNISMSTSSYYWRETLSFLWVAASEAFWWELHGLTCPYLLLAITEGEKIILSLSSSQWSFLTNIGLTCLSLFQFLLKGNCTNSATA